MMSSKENDVFYLKLQWIMCKDEKERERLAQEIINALKEGKGG